MACSSSVAFHPRHHPRLLQDSSITVVSIDTRGVKRTVLHHGVIEMPSKANAIAQITRGDKIAAPATGQLPNPDLLSVHVTFGGFTSDEDQQSGVLN